VVLTSLSPTGTALCDVEYDRAAGADRLITEVSVSPLKAVSSDGACDRNGELIDVELLMLEPGQGVLRGWRCWVRKALTPDGLTEATSANPGERRFSIIVLVSR